MFSEAKAFSKQQKSKQLQKLKWYCQLCEKQCRDENGFKCHLESDGHLRQMQVYAQNSNKIVADYSREFEAGFMAIVSTRYKTVAVKANQVYQDYIKDRDHVHMNATRWETLTGFCAYLSRTSKVVMGEDPQGFITIKYIDRDPEMVKRQEMALRKEKMDATDAERADKFLSRQVAMAQREAAAREAAKGEAGDDAKQPVKPGEEGLEETTISLAAAQNRKRKAVTSLGLDLDGDSDQGGSSDEAQGHGTGHGQGHSNGNGAGSGHGNASSNGGGHGHGQEAHSSKVSALDLLKEQNERIKAAKLREQLLKEQQKEQQQGKPASASGTGAMSSGGGSDLWITEGIVVKVLHKTLEDGKYYKEKGAIIAVDREAGLADIEMTESGDVIRLAQSHLETVIPKVGGQVKILSGTDKGKIAIVNEILFDDFAVRLEGFQGKFPYERVSRIA